MHQAMLLRDNNISKTLNLVRLFLSSKEYDTAEKHLIDYLNRYPDCGIALKMMSQIYEERGQPELALEYYQKSLVAKQNLNSSQEFTASPNTNRVSAVSRSSLGMNLSQNSTLDTSQNNQHPNGIISSEMKIDYNEIEKIIDSKIKPIQTSVQCIQETVYHIQSTHQQIFAAQADLHKLVSQNSKSHMPVPSVAPDMLTKLSNQMLESFQSLRSMIAPLEKNVTSLTQKNESVLQRLDTLKSEIEYLSTLVNENLDKENDDDYDEDYEDDDDHQEYRDSSNPISSAPKPQLCDMFKKSVSNWECPVCGTSNEDDKAKCVCCEEKNPNIKAPPATVSASKFSFGFPAQPVQSFVVPPPANPTPKIATPPKPFSFNQASGDLPKFGQASLPSSGSIFGTTPVNGFGGSPIGVTKPTENTKGSPFSGNSFGNFFANKPQENPVASVPQPLFGKPVEAIAAKPAQSTVSVFGPSSLTNSTSIFNSKPSETSSSGGSLFGTSNKLFGGTVFGSGGQTNFSFNNFSVTSPPKDQPKQAEPEDDKHPEEHEPEGVYKLPNVKLPENYSTVTGEEDEKVLFENRGKLFIHREDEFKERGLGVLKVLQSNKTGKIRILMRREHILKVCLNARLEDVSKLEIIENKFLRFSAIDFSESEPTTGIFLLRFSNIELLKQLKQMIETLENNPVSVVSGNDIQPNEDPDIHFVGKVEPTPEQLKKINELKLPINFYAFESSKKPCKGCRGCTDSEIVYRDTAQKTNGQASKENVNTDYFSGLVSDLNIPSSTVDNINTSRTMENGNDEDHVVTTDFTSSKSKLLPTDFVVKTGEEDDEVLFNERAKLYRFTNDEYKERGVGPMKILKNKQNGSIRLLMRREQVHKVVCNHGIKNLNVQLHKSNNRVVNWVARDYSDSNEGTDEVFLLRFRSDQLAQSFVNKIQELQAN